MIKIKKLKPTNRMKIWVCSKIKINLAILYYNLKLFVQRSICCNIYLTVF